MRGWIQNLPAHAASHWLKHLHSNLESCETVLKGWLSDPTCLTVHFLQSQAMKIFLEAALLGTARAGAKSAKFGNSEHLRHPMNPCWSLEVHGVRAVPQSALVQLAEMHQPSILRCACCLLHFASVNCDWTCTTTQQTRSKTILLIFSNRWYNWYGDGCPASRWSNICGVGRLAGRGGPLLSFNSTLDPPQNSCSRSIIPSLAFLESVFGFS